MSSVQHYCPDKTEMSYQKRSLQSSCKVPITCRVTNQELKIFFDARGEIFVDNDIDSEEASL